MMNNDEFEKLRLEYEKGKIAVKELSYEEINKLSEYYKDEIETNKREKACPSSQIYMPDLKFEPRPDFSDYIYSLFI